MVLRLTETSIMVSEREESLSTPNKRIFLTYLLDIWSPPLLCQAFNQAVKEVASVILSIAAASMSSSIVSTSSQSSPPVLIRLNLLHKNPPPARSKASKTQMILIKIFFVLDHFLCGFFFFDEFLFSFGSCGSGSS